LGGCGDNRIERRVNMAEAKDGFVKRAKGPILPQEEKTF